MYNTYIRTYVLSYGSHNFSHILIPTINPLTRKILINFLPGNRTIILVFTQAPLKAPAIAECEAHALFVIHKTNLRFISYLNI